MSTYAGLHRVGLTRIPCRGVLFAALILVGACSGGAGSEEGDTASDAVSDALADVSGFDLPDGVSDPNPPGGCIGAASNPVWKEQYGPFCQSVLTPAAVEAGIVCVLISENPTDAACYCAECGLRGIDYLCFREVCE